MKLEAKLDEYAKIFTLKAIAEICIFKNAHVPKPEILFKSLLIITKTSEEKKFVEKVIHIIQPSYVL